MPKLAPVVVFVLTLLCQTAYGNGNGDCNSDSRLHHVVVVWLKPQYQQPDDIQRLIAAHTPLRDIPDVLALDVGIMLPSDRPVVDSSYDVASHFVFCDAESMQRYVMHSNHQVFLRQYAATMIDRYTVFDFVSD